MDKKGTNMDKKGTNKVVASKPDTTAAEGKWTCLMEMVDKCHNILGLSIESTLNGDVVMVLHPRLDRPSHGQTVIIPIGWDWVHAVHIDKDTQSIEFRLEGREDGPTFKHKVSFAPFTGETRDALVLRMRKVAKMSILPGGKVEAEEVKETKEATEIMVATEVKNEPVKVEEPMKAPPSIDSPVGWLETGVLNELGKLLEKKASAADVLALLQPGLRKYDSKVHDCCIGGLDVCLFPAHGLAIHVDYKNTQLGYLTIRKIVERHCGDQHFEDGPAEVFWSVNGYMSKYSWYKNGKLHRIGKPAVMKLDKMGKTDEAWWYVDGKLHREDGPAHLIDRDPTDPTSPKGAPHHVEQYYLNGVLHPCDGSTMIERHCFVYDADKKLDKLVETHMHAETSIVVTTNIAEPSKSRYAYHSFNDRPAIMEKDKDGRILKQVWCKDGKKHREGNVQMPAVIEWSQKSPRTPLVQKWYRDDELHRDDHDQPAMTVMDEDGTVVKEVWAKNGKLHRVDKPALIVMKNGKYRQAYYTEGKLVKEVGDCSEKEPEEP